MDRLRGLKFSDAVPLAQYGEGSGESYRFSCMGDESRLQDCKRLSMNYCEHSDSAGLKCAPG